MIIMNKEMNSWCQGDCQVSPHEAEEPEFVLCSVSSQTKTSILEGSCFDIRHCRGVKEEGILRDGEIVHPAGNLLKLRKYTAPDS